MPELVIDDTNDFEKPFNLYKGLSNISYDSVCFYETIFFNCSDLAFSNVTMNNPITMFNCTNISLSKCTIQNSTLSFNNGDQIWMNEITMMAGRMYFYYSNYINISNFTITRYPGYEYPAINVHYSNHTSIRSMQFTGTSGMQFYYSNNNYMENCTFNDSPFCLTMVNCGDTEASKYYVNNSMYGCYIVEYWDPVPAKKVALTDITINNTDIGIYLGSISGVVLRNVSTNNCTTPLNISGSASQKLHDIDASFKIDGNPILYLINESNIHIKDRDVKFLYCANCSNVSLANVTFLGGSCYSFSVCDDISLVDCVLLDPEGMLSCYRCTNVTILSLKASNTEEKAVLINFCSNFYLGDSSFFNCSQHAVEFYETSNATIENTLLSGGVVGVLFRYSDNISLAGTTVSHMSFKGVECDRCQDIRFDGCSFDNNTVAVEAYSYGYHESIGPMTISDCIFSSNSQYGLECYKVLNSTIRNCTFLNNGDDALYLKDSEKLLIEDCHISGSEDSGIFLSKCQEILFKNLYINRNGKGIYTQESSNNVYCGLNLSNNRMHGCIFDKSSDNQIYGCSFCDNGKNAYDDANNSWHNGTNGNYWSDYHWYDEDSDGIGDRPYSIPGGDNKDHYPLGYFKASPPPPSIYQRIFGALQKYGLLTVLFGLSFFLLGSILYYRRKHFH